MEFKDNEYAEVLLVQKQNKDKTKYIFEFTITAINSIEDKELIIIFLNSFDKPPKNLEFQKKFLIL